MAIGVLAIAQGAAKVAGKIFQGVKKRREAKVEKAAGRLLEAEQRRSQINQLFSTPGIVQGNAPIGTLKKPAFISSLSGLIDPGAGSQAISGAANALQQIKGGAVAPRDAKLVAEEVSVGTGKGFDPKWLLYGAVALIALPFIKKLIR